MCKLCNTNPVYEFTNQRKLCKNCFIKWFDKKVLYTIRKFKMINKNDVIGYNVSGTQGRTPKNIQKNIFTKGNDFRSVVLEDVLKIVEGKGVVELRSLQSRSQINNFATGFAKSLRRNFINVKKFRDNYVSTENRAERRFGVINREAKPSQIKITKIAVPVTTDLTAYKIVNEIIKGNIKNLKEAKPVEGKIIKPLYLFLDKEVLIYANLKKLKIFPAHSHSQIDNFATGFAKSLRKNPINEKSFLNNLVLAKKSDKVDFEAMNNSERSEDKTDRDKSSKFIDELEKKHPEVKRAIVNGIFKLS